jgi:hypothetical protein
VTEQLAAEYEWTLARLGRTRTRQPVIFLISFRAMNRDFFRQLRTLLILGRVSNLPTVWSNCLRAGGSAAAKTLETAACFLASARFTPAACF